MLCPALLALEDGSVFKGTAFGYIENLPHYVVAELVFNTAMTGYQEILSDPSYSGQIITFTSPQIGNVGVNAEDEESCKIFAKGLVVRQLSPIVSNWRAQASLADYLRQHKVLGISEIDTRALTHILRTKGTLNACLYAAQTLTPDSERKAQALAQGKPDFSDVIAMASTPKVYEWQEKSWFTAQAQPARYHVVAYDYGIKQSILRCLVDVGCKVTVVPHDTTVAQVRALAPDGIFLSNGPGDPQTCVEAIATVAELLQLNIPLFGICLGHQLLALACQGKTSKMKFGHHGGNHPVSVLADKSFLITSQNHNFMVDEASLPECLTITHRSLFDNSIQGLQHKTLPAFSFQGHPEAGPGPNDAKVLFQQFVDIMAQHRK